MEGKASRGRQNRLTHSCNLYWQRLGRSQVTVPPAFGEQPEAQGPLAWGVKAAGAQGGQGLHRPCPLPWARPGSGCSSAGRGWSSGAHAAPVWGLGGWTL